MKTLDEKLEKALDHIHTPEAIKLIYEVKSALKDFMHTLINGDTTKITRDQLIGLIDTMRIDAILGECDNFDQDELGKILAVLGVGEYKEIYDEKSI